MLFAMHSAMVGFMRIADLFDSSRAGTKSVHANMTVNGNPKRSLYWVSAGDCSCRAE
jgi:hypothetical protein